MRRRCILGSFLWTCASITRSSKGHSATWLRKADAPLVISWRMRSPGTSRKLEELRGALDARYNELKAGRVRVIDAETAANTLTARSEERRNGA